ncbi:MAG: ABC transporter permease [Desulfuromonadales bacterium]|nr:ABC transporter permease [Desulfuromonadales bacterium]
MHSVSPLTFIRSAWRNRHLIGQMVRREVGGRYRGSVLGLLWSFLNPLFMLVIYTFVFSVVFQARWGEGSSGSRTEFAMILFSGLIVFNLFAEVVNRSPTLILGHPNLVKKVVFPLEVLPVVAAGSALFHALVSLGVLLGVRLLLDQEFSPTVVFLPLLLLPLLLVTLGVSWFLASIGVFLRDTSQTIGIVTTAMLFLSPVFFPVSALPEAFRAVQFLNPLAFPVEESRNLLIWGKMPQWSGMALYLLFSVLVAWCGLFWFQRTRKGFADVL